MVKLYCYYFAVQILLISCPGGSLMLAHLLYLHSHRERPGGSSSSKISNETEMKVHFLFVHTSCDKFQFSSSQIQLKFLHCLSYLWREPTFKHCWYGSNCWFHYVGTLWVFFSHFFCKPFVFLACSACQVLNL